MISGRVLGLRRQASVGGPKLEPTWSGASSPPNILLHGGQTILVQRDGTEIRFSFHRDQIFVAVRFFPVQARRMPQGAALVLMAYS